MPVLLDLSLVALVLIMSFGIVHASWTELVGEGVPDLFRVSKNNMIFSMSLGMVIFSASAFTFFSKDIASLMLATLLGGILFLSAWLDKKTGWAPDSLTLPLAFIEALLFIDTPGWSGVAQSVLLGCGIFLGSMGLWLLQSGIDRRILTPPDMIAVLLPFAFFGLQMETAVIFMLTAIILLACLKSEKICSLFADRQARLDASEDAGVGDGPSVTFLAVIFPAFSIIFIASSLSNSL